MTQDYHLSIGFWQLFQVGRQQHALLTLGCLTARRAGRGYQTAVQDARGFVQGQGQLPLPPGPGPAAARDRRSWTFPPQDVGCEMPVTAPRNLPAFLPGSPGCLAAPNHRAANSRNFLGLPWPEYTRWHRPPPECRRDCVVYVALTDGHGDMAVSVRLVEVKESNPPIFEAETVVSFVAE